MPDSASPSLLFIGQVGDAKDNKRNNKRRHAEQGNKIKLPIRNTVRRIFSTDCTRPCRRHRVLVAIKDDGTCPRWTSRRTDEQRRKGQGGLGYSALPEYPNYKTHSINQQKGASFSGRVSESLFSLSSKTAHHLKPTATDRQAMDEGAGRDLFWGVTVRCRNNINDSE